MIEPTPLLDCFRRGEADRETRMLAARGVLAPRALEQLSILVLLVDDPDVDIQRSAEETLASIPQESLKAFLGRSDVPIDVREFFGDRGIFPDEIPQTGADPDVEPPLVAAPVDPDGADESEDRLTATQRLSKMGFTGRLKAAVHGSREMRSLLIRDPNKMIASAVLSSPKVTEPEIESFARMATLSDEVLRIIGSNRAWTKNYNIVLALTKNPKTPLAMSLAFMSRLNSRDLAQLSVNRNVAEPLRIAARKRVVASQSGHG